MNIIGDIAGEYDTLMALLKQMPDDEVLSVGDMIDRGPKSKEVVEWFMKNGKALLGNHEHMMLDAIRGPAYYDHGIWMWNGGGYTLNSFDTTVQGMLHAYPDVIQWVENLPYFMELDDILISHSFVRPDRTLAEACDIGLGHTSYEKQLDQSVLWSRWHPERIDKYSLQVAGHNSQWGFREFIDDKGKFAICLDDSRSKKLTGLHWPSMTIYQQDFLP